MTTRKGSATEFLKTFGFEGSHNGLSCSKRISDNRIVRYTLSERNGRGGTPTMGTYVSIKVEVINIKTGPVATEFFRFDDHICERVDDRNDYPSHGNSTFMVISHCGWDWYIAIPATVRPIKKAVADFVAMFGEEVVELVLHDELQKAIDDLRDAPPQDLPLLDAAQERIDVLVHDMKGAEAADINNGGFESQVQFLLKNEVSKEDIIKTLKGK